MTVARETTLPDGLTAAEAARRREAGLANVAPSRTSRTVGEILRANLLTRFNALIGVLAALVLVFGHPIDALFGLVVVVNSAIGVVQELRAKRTLDRLAVLARVPVRVRRDGVEQLVPPEDVVVGDLVLLATGDRLPVDGELVASDGLEIDESLLTGEADPVAREPGDEVLSGSFVVAGSGAFVATRVGADSYAARLVAEASVFSLARSELYQGINRFLRYITWVIVPVGTLLVIRQLTTDQSFPDSVVGSVAGVVPMIPEGLVLMTSIAFAVGVVRLGRRQCLVQELPAVEVLARVDTLCLDKTGTLTEPGMRLKEVAPAPGAPPAEELSRVLAALVGVDASPNPTICAVAEAVGPPPPWRVVESVPFSSARKYSGATFADRGSWLLGAPEVLLAAGDPLLARAERLAAEGLRVLVLARAAGLADPDRTGVALVVLEQRLRPAARDTLRWFATQDVAAKVISGDNATSVGAIARQLGLPGADRPVDARDLPEDPDALAAALENHSVFGRVTPHQKRAFVRALRSRGHTVAMTGDGVNDALALKDADLGIAMGSGSGATRAVAKVVLLNNDFTSLPQVLGEGRRVLANIERVANLFLTKTVYSVALAVLVGLAHLPYPFLPRHITLIGALTIGIPAFFLALAPSDERARPGFVPRVLRFAVPAGATCAAASFAAYLFARNGGDLVGQRSVAAITLFLVAFLALTLVARPLAAWKVAMLGALGGAFALVLAWPAARQLAQLEIPEPRNALVVLGVTLAAGAVLYAGLRRAHWLDSGTAGRH
ncbi:MAG: HAD-IC family P-type ATPase [Micromonosporaceae bacterium]|jgi:cation-transporting ATPase E